MKIILIDTISAPIAYLFGILLKSIRDKGINKFPKIKRSLLKAGIFPIRNHYYEPLIDYQLISDESLTQRKLENIPWNEKQQIDLLSNFIFTEELSLFPFEKTKKDGEFFYKNGNYEFGDADIWYSLIRYFKPRRIVEVGSGYSTLIAVAAIKNNKDEDATYDCNITCIEPYEMPWLEKTGAIIIRKKVEDIESSIFEELQSGDVLFIDSSHMIRPQGDVLKIYLDILPKIKPGVIVHIHDIFSPRDYPAKWLKDEMRFWNEQYLVEAILSSGNAWEVLLANNLLKNNYFDNFKKCCPYISKDHEPGSFYIRRV